MPSTYAAVTFLSANLGAYLGESLSSPPRPPAAAESSGGKRFPSTKVPRKGWIVIPTEIRQRGVNKSAREEANALLQGGEFQTAAFGDSKPDADT